jgi:hypothetical protein
MIISVRLVAVLSLILSSCALLMPSTSIGLSRVSEDYQLGVLDTTKTILNFDSRIDLDFDLNGSERFSIRPGFSRWLVDRVMPGWFYLDVIGSSMWVRGLPVYLIGGDTVAVEVDNDHLVLDSRPFFTAQQEKSTRFPFVPVLSMSCIGCTRAPILKFDGQQLDYVAPEISVDAGWHTIEFYSPFDNVSLYYRTLFDNYTITEFTLYPVPMN